MLKGINTTITFLFLFAFINSCSFFENDKDSFDSSLYTKTTVHAESTYNNCSPKSDACAYMSFDYPQFKNEANSEILKKINASVIKTMLTYTEANSPDKACEEFINNYKSFIDNPDVDESNTAWFDKRDAEWLSIQKKVMSVKCNVSNFMGGAHENNFVMLRNFTPLTGDSIGLNMIFDTESLKELSNQGEMKFRAKQGLKKEESFEEAGYWFPDNEFYLTENFAFTQEGLLFYYNEYEIAPYSKGAIYFVVPYSLIMHLFD